MGWFRNVMFGSKSKIAEFEDVKEQKKERRNISVPWKTIFSGDIIMKSVKGNVGMIALLLVLVFIYIGNQFYCKKRVLEISRLEAELKDLRFEALTRSADLMEVSKRSNVKRRVREMGIDIEEPVTPPVRIED